VNDRPYAANSFLSVALGRIFTMAMSGRSKERQELAETGFHNCEPFTGSLSFNFRGYASVVIGE
jgi:RNA repair, ligase-Pnkp-associating, region of Hen1